MTIKLHQGDLPEEFVAGDSIAVDTETQGLSLVRDRLCVVQLSAGDGVAHLVQFSRDVPGGPAYAAPRLRAVLEDPSVLKIFHFARFDLAMLKRWMGVDCTPVCCTKVASKLVRTFTDRHGLKDLCRDLIGIELNKQQQSSDWAADTLSEEQRRYAASDVLYLHDIKAALDTMLAREERTEIAQSCFDFLPTRAALDLLGWEETDIFAH